MSTIVVNKYKEPYDVDITRKGPFGNPFYLDDESKRDEVILQCRRHHAKRILEDRDFRKAVLKLRGKRLGCVCKPRPCHGDFLVEFLELGVVDAEVRENPPVLKFRDDHSFLRNFWYTGKPMVIDGRSYDTAEHYYQSQKAILPDDELLIATAPTPALAKSRGRQVPSIPWTDDEKLTVMTYAVLEKFTQSPALGLKLLATGDALLIEGNYWHDNFWGRCTCGRRCENFGFNHLGDILMYVRNFLRIDSG